MGLLLLSPCGVFQSNRSIPSTAVSFFTFGRKHAPLSQCIDYGNTVHVRKLMCPSSDIRSSLPSTFKYASFFTHTG